MSREIDVQNERGFAVNDKRLIAAALATLDAMNAAADAGLTVVITGDDDVQALNRQYRGMDSVTDVLSFPTDSPSFPGEAPYLGDLVIAYPYARAQADRAGQSCDDGLALLVVHGTLHLLGQDHDTPENRATMWGHQGQILAALGIDPDVVPLLEAPTDPNDKPDPE